MADQTPATSDLLSGYITIHYNGDRFKITLAEIIKRYLKEKTFDD